MTDKNNAQSIKPLLAAFDIDAPDIAINNLTLDSRDVAVHSAFLAIKGHQSDGRDFIPQAISLGARVILAETDEPQRHGELGMREQSVIIQFYQLPQLLSELAAMFYHQPADNLDVIAVTGTNGKTSCVQLITQLRLALGDKAASIGTLGSGMQYPGQANSALQSTLNTTPDAISMQKLLDDFAVKGAAQVALEASSHALVQHRLSSVKTDVAVFTNLTRDHLDYHGSMAEYARAKRLLLRQRGLRWAIINADDREAQSWLNAMPYTVTPVLFSIEDDAVTAIGSQRYAVAKNICYHNDGCRFQLCSSWGDAEIHVPLLGQFNVANIVAALTAQLVLDKPLAQLAAACRKLSAVAGRMELFTHAQGANIAVDYAHTPDALQQALIALRRHTKGKLWCVFGCGGERDQGKRPLMGEVAEQYADRLVITNDNSRSEAPQQIAEDILKGCRAPQDVLVQLQRKQAIRDCLAQADSEDVILVAGKGHEDYQIIDGQTLPYNERLFVQELVKRKMP